MQHIITLHWAFLAQIIVISLGLPWLVIRRVKQAIDRYPLDLHPELYPVPPQAILDKAKTFLLLNAVVAALGLWLLAHTRSHEHTEFLNWDSQSVIMLFFLFQYTPYLWLSIINKGFNEQLRTLNKECIKVASLKPRKVTDYIAAWQWLVLAVAWGAFTLMVLYVHFAKPFQGFAGLWNLLAMVGVNLFYAVVTHLYISRSKPAPTEDRELANMTFCRTMITINALSAVYLTWSLGMHLFELRPYSDVFQTIYLQVIAVITYLLFTHKNHNAPVQSV